ncbi:ABC transporter permease subunit [uncultured Clostridium sp.]|uniref:sugar ABC transporter permease n=1 Tax=uncultured Clostridium sp. TaxID=59620 RepID=UPI0025DD2F48|nr:ABC transporter permease subunit [uncultured Clostridium sp.]
MKTKKIVSDSLVHLLLAVLSIIWLLPIVWIVLISFRSEKGAYTSTFLPQSYTIDNYVRLFTETDMFNFPIWFRNTLVVAIFSCAISTFFVLSISYVFSRLRFKLRKRFMNIALILGMFPGFMSMIAVYYILKGVGLTTGVLKLVSLVLVYSAGSCLTFYVAKGFFDTIPKAIDEAAIIDGCTKWQVFTKIIIPLSKPIIVQTIIQAFMAPWIDFIFSKVIAGSEPQYYTVAVGLWNMLTKENITNYYTRFAAGAVLVSIPIAILFCSVQKYYMESNSGAVKG